MISHDWSSQAGPVKTVKAKKKTMSTACITVSSEELGFYGLPFQQEKTRTTTVELPFEEYTGNSTCLFSGGKRLVVGKDSYIHWNLGFCLGLKRHMFAKEGRSLP